MSLFLMFVLENSEKQKLYYPLTVLKNNAVGEFEDISAFHITLKKIGNNDSQHKPIIDIMQQWHKKYARGPVTIYATQFGRFNNSYRTIDWIGLSQTLRLYEIKAEFEHLAEINNINILKDTFSYVPHITCGFNLEYLKNFNKKFDPIPITIKNLALYAYDHKINNVHMAAIMHIVSI